MKGKIVKIGTAFAATVTAVTCLPQVVFAENPIVQTSFTPDPAPVVFDDELWVFTGRDRDGDNDFYYMTGWQAYSTTDMVNWTAHGCFLEDDTFSWCNENDAWASQCIERNGKYYFYFTTTSKSGGGRAIGVAVADKPEGPYKDVLGKPLCGPNWDYIDPTVIIDDDGQAWLMFGNPKCYYVKLKEDMVTLDGEIQSFNMTTQAFGTGKNDTAYGEGPWITKHNDIYYLVYAGFYGSDGGESMCYSYGPSVTGPWTFGGQITGQSNCYTTHGGTIDYKGHSYLFYHMNGIPGGGTFNRSAAVEEFTYNSDGTIPKISTGKSGVKQIESLNPFQRNEAETICWEEGVKVEDCNAGGQLVGYIQNNSYIKVKGVDFGEGADSFTASVASASGGGKIELHIDSKDGDIIGTCNVSDTGGWQDWEKVSCDVDVSGEHDLYFVFTGGSGYLLNFDWWQFEGSGMDIASNSDGYLLHNTFEGKTESWKGRGSASVASNSSESYQGNGSLYVSGRESSWNGATRSLGTILEAGETYSFSANVKYDSGKATDKFKLQIQYKLDGEEDTQYVNIAQGTAAKGEWIQLSNTDFTIPKGASDIELYVETESSTVNFYLDDVIIAEAGTTIEGAGKGSAREIIKGDVNGDLKIDGLDLASAKNGLMKKFANSFDEQAADVDENGVVEISDIIHIQKFLLHEITEFPVAEKVETPKRTISEYTPVVAASVSEFETNDSKTEKAGVTYGTIQKKSYYSNFCGRTKNYNVLLPANYSEDKEYPVLYVLHGYYENPDRMIIEGNGTMYTRQIIGNAIAEGAAEDMIVVFPDVFSSKTLASCTGMNDENNQAYDNFDTVLTTELMPLIEKEYSVKTGRENTAITGFSMGGRESLQTAMKHPDLFGYVGAICPAPGASGAWKFESEEASPYLIFITAGSNDTVVYTTPNGYHENFTNNNVPHVWHYVNGGYHGDNSIHAHMYNFVRAIFKA